MPPPDLSSTYLAQQQQLLREIRDELRTTRTSSTPSAGPMAGAPSANAPWIHAQMSADKMLSGEWNTLGWSNSYSSHYKSTLSGDILGAMGMRPAPSTMHQIEFERMASESLSTRMGSLPFDMLAGGTTHGFNSRSREMASDLLAYSARFRRAGDTGAGPMGNGMGMGEANSLARGLQASAINDLRMSGKDYNEVLRGGLQSGQFDFTKTIDELKQKFTELKDSVADVTRANRTTVEETVRAFGALRQMGVGEVGSQRAVLNSLGSAARVSGTSFGEMAQVAFGAVTPGFASGLTAETSIGLASGNLAMTREASRAGVLDPGLMARGGGAAGIASSITSAQQRFLGTAAAKLAFNGGTGAGGFMGAMQRGLNTSARGLDSALAFEAQTMEDVDPAKAAELHTGFIRQQLSLMGVTDFSSTQARNMAFSMTRGDMGDAAALSFANMNFTRAGQQSQRRQDFARRADEERTAGMHKYDQAYNATSMMSQFRRGIGAMGTAMYEASDWLSNKLSPGQSGLFGFGGRYREDVAMMGLGAASGSMSMEAWAEYDGRKEAAMPKSGVLTGLGARGAGSILGGVGGAGGAAALAGFAGLTVATGGLAAVGAIGAMTVGGLAGAYIGGGIGGMFGAETTLTGASLSNYANTYAASQTTSADASRINDAMRGSKSFQALTANLNRTALSPDGSLGTQKMISDAAKEAGVSEADVIAGYKGIGGSLGMEAIVETFSGGKKGTDLIANLLKGDMEKTGISAASAEFNMAARDYVKATRTNDTKGQHAALAAFQKMGIEGAPLQALRDNVANVALNGNDLAATEQALESGAKTAMGANAQVAFEAIRKGFVTDFAELKGKGGTSNTVFDWLDKASASDMRETLLGQGPNKAALMGLMKTKGGFEDVLAIQESGFDFASGKAQEASARFHLSGATTAKLAAWQKEGKYSSEQMRNAVMMDKLGTTPDDGLDKESKTRVQAMQAMTAAMTALVNRLTGEK